ncbi:putative Xylitol dehydrogenase XdhB [Taphrina deformans PYCC 5710]|uniref:Xylitol dehydrogenase XdhB n=1 Tax=Taphrina deformans (strain PYCC 5710 / ATCC 11124 / CBS 356.35 / IMI 108563 / JCM 9778 / NBRC 8474) TaxID=1097556 RepID=R4X779_TAPDE|nr:putative Xylitol dehydrogenase XdhB [Taphrina deformans PYCC 5710]|eukprot:CCG80918.1 putative Xylitol dehydrogenase XdhB [Taphrina deformans PYCC 5710]
MHAPEFYESPALYTTPGPEHRIYMNDTKVARPTGTQVLVHVKATGVCGSDVHFWKHGGIGPMQVKKDCGLGHESSGIVEAVGPDVTLWKVGDRVAIEPGVPCGKASCHFCRTGRYNACPDVVFYSTPPVNGLLTRYHLHPQDWLHALPDSLSFEEGSMLEPLSVALAGIERSDLRLGDEVLICGAGPIGLVSLLCAKAAGACPLVITDISAGRLAFAKKLVPTVHTVLVTPDMTAHDVAGRVRAQMGGTGALGPKLAVECTGVQSSVHSAIFASRFGGTVFVIGVGRDEMVIPFMHLSAQEIDLRFQYRYHETWPKAIRLVQEGYIDLKPLVTHRYPLEEAVTALHTASDPNMGAIKTMILDDRD